MSPQSSAGHPRGGATRHAVFFPLLLCIRGEPSPSFKAWEKMDEGCWSWLDSFWAAKRAAAWKEAQQQPIRCKDTVLRAKWQSYRKVRVVDTSVPQVWVANVSGCPRGGRIWGNACAPMPQRFVRRCPSCHLDVPVGHLDETVVFADDGRSRLFLPRLPLRRIAKARRPSIYLLVLDAVSRQAMKSLMPRTSALFLGNKTAWNLPEGWRSAWFSSFHTLQSGGTIENFFNVPYGGILKEGNDTHRRIRCLNPFIGPEIVRNWTHTDRHLSALAHAGNARFAFSASIYIPLIHDALAADDVVPSFFEIASLVASFRGERLELERSDFTCFAGATLMEHGLAWNAARLEGGDRKLVYSHFRAFKHPLPLKHMHKLANLDIPLRRHLHKVMRRNDVAIFLLSDHGRLELMCDQRNPFLGLLVPRNWAPLLAQSDKLVSSWDVYATIRQLLAVNGSMPLPGDDLAGMVELADAGLCVQPSPQRDWSLPIPCMRPASMKPISLLAPSLIPWDRTCAQAGIFEDHCSLYGTLWWTHLCVDGGERLSQATRDLMLHFSADVTQVVWCDIGAKLAARATKHANAVLAAAGAHACWPLRVDAVELVTHEMFSTMLSKKHVVRFRLRESPARVFDATFFYTERGAVEDPDQYALLAVSQVTRYRDYEWCAPLGESTPFCRCEMRTTSEENITIGSTEKVEGGDRQARSGDMVVGAAHGAQIAACRQECKHKNLIGVHVATGGECWCGEFRFECADEVSCRKGMPFGLENAKHALGSDRGSAKRMCVCAFDPFAWQADAVPSRRAPNLNCST
eukprot:TRINITY_DN2847_c0_g1_i2.p1 TRINITY_DN2847_c0_g1~~TRINITY_DN2847_c0_g1_i2.p1  ORF type:complete len:801 (-),score=71.01 TRINITY_DN2847_c0_g1_i2:241-2643(-)